LLREKVETATMPTNSAEAKPNGPVQGSPKKN
jgi:hypothetical protein